MFSPVNAVNYRIAALINCTEFQEKNCRDHLDVLGFAQDKFLFSQYRVDANSPSSAVFWAIQSLGA